MQLTGQFSGRRILIYLSGIFTIDELRKGEFLSLRDREVSNAVLFSNNEKGYIFIFNDFNGIDSYKWILVWSTLIWVNSVLF